MFVNVGVVYTMSSLEYIRTHACHGPDDMREIVVAAIYFM